MGGQEVVEGEGRQSARWSRIDGLRDNCAGALRLINDTRKPRSHKVTLPKYRIQFRDVTARHSRQRANARLTVRLET